MQSLCLLILCFILLTGVTSFRTFTQLPSFKSTPFLREDQAKLSFLNKNIGVGNNNNISIRRSRVQPLKDILGLGVPEIAVIAVAALVLFGPETLKSLSKDVGKAAAELKEIPKTFKEGMEEGQQEAQLAKLKAMAAEKRKKRADKERKRDDDDDEEEDEEETPQEKKKKEEDSSKQKDN